MDKIYLAEVDSTNLYAKSNIENLADRTLVITSRQTSGRGRFTRAWVDLGGENLFMSIVLKPSETFKDIYSNLTQLMCVALCKVFEEYGIKPSIKWPNDVLVNGKKISGILSESVVQGDKFKGLVLGVGVNLNASEEKLSLIDKKATALNLETGKSISLDDFLNKLLNVFWNMYDEFILNGFSLIKDDYIKRASFLNESISVQVLNNLISGVAKQITDNGELVVVDNSNKDVVLTIGDIL